MKGVKAIRTVEDLQQYLSACNPKAIVRLMSETGDGDGFPVGGVIELNGQDPNEVWILIDEFAEGELHDTEVYGEVSMEWSGTNIEDEGCERPGDPAYLVDDSPGTMSCLPQPNVAPTEKTDVIKVRGQMRVA